MSAAPLQLDTLVEGGQRPEHVGAALADWIAGARRTLDIALYSVHVPGPVGDRIFAALRDASARGVAVRALVHRPDLQPTPLHATAAPRTRVDVLRRAGVHIELTEQVRDLMHHKFAVRDDAAVWTGSTNWTLDDFGAEENVIVRVDSRGDRRRLLRGLHRAVGDAPDRRHRRATTRRSRRSATRWCGPGSARAAAGRCRTAWPTA